MTSQTLQYSAESDAAMQQFETETSRYGRWTMIAGLIFSLAGPFYLFFFTDLQVNWAMVLTAFLAVAAAFGVLWVLEPVTYYPILGQAAMYQAFMIGNISNKLLPAAIVAQSSIQAKAGTRRADISAVMAIGGAATVHLISLLVFVGILGTWLLSIIPTEVIDVARLYILPSLIGGVLVQTIVALKQVRTTVVAIAVALVIHFLLLPVAPQVAMYGTAIAVVVSVVVAWLVRDRSAAARDRVNAEAEMQQDPVAD